MTNPLPQGWKEDRIDNLSYKILSGGTPNRSISSYYGGNIPWVKTGEVQDCVIYDTEEKITEEGLKNSSAKVFPKGTLLVALYGATAAKLAILAIDAATNQACCGIQVDESKILMKYIYYYLLDQRSNLLALTSGAGQQNLNVGKIKNYYISYPTDKDEQDYIVKTLDAVAEMIRLRKETIQLTKDLIPAIFQEMFGDPITNPKGWEITTLGNPDVCTLQYGYTATAQDSGDTRYIRITDIGKDGYIDNGNKAWLNYDNKMEDYKLYHKDILVARTGASYGKTLLYNNDTDAIFASFLIRIIFNKKKIIPEFYWAYSLTDSYWQQANRLVSGVAQPQFNGSALKQILLMLPPWPLQEKFAKKDEQINKYIVAQQEELEHFETLFQSLLQEAFTGILTWKYPRKENND